jgi:disulfide oxidoreductase YuzD
MKSRQDIKMHKDIRGSLNVIHDQIRPDNHTKMTKFICGMLGNSFNLTKDFKTLIASIINFAEDKVLSNLDDLDLKVVDDDSKNHDCCPNSEENSSGQKNVNTTHSNYQKADSCNNSEVDIPTISEEKESLNHSIPQKVVDKTRTYDEIDLNHSTNQKEMKDIQENLDEYDYEYEEEFEEEEEPDVDDYFLETCKTQLPFLQSQLRNTKIIHDFQIQEHHVFIKKLHIPKIIDPINYIRKKHFYFCKPFSLNAKSFNNNPNAFDDEDEAIDK